MDIRLATQADAGRIESFLSAHADSSMFLRGNLEAHGVGKGEHPHSTDFLIWPAEGEIRAVFGITGHGYLMVQCPGLEREAFAATAAALRGRVVGGLTGNATQVECWLDALGLSGRERVKHLEPLYVLDLSGLEASDVSVRRPVEEDEAWLADWFLGYEADVGTGPADPDAAVSSARARARRVILDGPVLLLLEEDRPVGMASINAQVADMVQVGGVYVPPAERNRGVGRRVVRALLSDAAEKGGRRAILFSNNDAASRAYESIGFRRTGDYLITVFHPGTTVKGGVPA